MKDNQCLGSICGRFALFTAVKSRGLLKWSISGKEKITERKLLNIIICRLPRLMKIIYTK